MTPAVTRALARIDRNVADYYADRITYAEFTRRARATWAEIERRPRLLRAVSAEVGRRTRNLALAPKRAA